jgi:hypothetical protein
MIEWIEVTIDCGDVGVVAEFWKILFPAGRAPPRRCPAARP